MNKQKILTEAKGYAFMLVACVAYGISTAIFLAPNSVVGGGLSGLAVLLNLLTKKLSIGMLIIMLNVPVLLLGIKFQGWKFIFRCLLTILCLGVITDLLERFISPITEDPLLASLYGGVCQGIGIGLFVRYEFSSGGTELLGRIISRFLKFLKIPVAVGILDGIIVILGAIFTKNPDNMLYALIVIFVSTKVSEIILIGLEKSKLCFIITDKGEELSKTLLENSPRGVTMLEGEGMYTHKEHNVLMTCVKNRQLPQLRELVKKVDENAFIIINDSVEVRGKGFQSLREGEENNQTIVRNKKQDMDMKNTKFDIIIQGGQSNAEGFGLGPVSEEYIPSESVLYLEAEKTAVVVDNNLHITYADKPFYVEVAQDRKKGDDLVGDFSLTFAEEYRKSGLLSSDRKLLVIRVAVGGAGFKKGQWGIGKQLYEKLLEMTDYALSLNKENRVVGFLWHQGEHDAFEKNEPETFKEQLGAQLQSIRSRYGDMPFIAGDFVNEWKSKNLADCKPIVEKIQEVIIEAGNGAFVETADLPSNNEKTGNGDDIHFCRESLRVLGRRYFAAYRELIKNK